MSDILSYGPTSDQEIQQQANVTMNVGRSPNCVQQLKFAVSSRPSGTFIEGPIDPLHMMVNRQDLVFVRVTGRDDRSKQGNRVTYQVDTFSSFNGQVYPEGTTQSQFQRMFKLIGVATSGQDFTGDIPNKAGFAAVTAGSISIKNHSNVTFFPGDLVAWVAPNIDKSKRSQQYKSMHIAHLDTNTALATKNMATLERVCVADIVDKWSDIAELLLGDSHKFHVHGIRHTILRGSIPKDFTDEQAGAVWLKQYTSLVAYQALVVAAQFGMITPDAALTAPAGNPAIQRYLETREIIADGVDNWRTIQMGVGADRREGDELQAFEDEINNFAHNMARITGLVAPGTSSNVTEDHGFIHRILSRVLYSNLSEVKNSEAYIKFISDEFNTQIGNLPDIFGHLNTGNPSVPLQMLRVKGDALRSLYHSITTNVLSFTDRVIGTASNTSRPGTQIHMVLSS